MAALGPDRPEKERFLVAFGQTIKSLRAAAGLSQTELAARCFLRHDHVSDLERGKRAPDLIVLLMLARALGASVTELTDGLAAPSRAVGMAGLLAFVAQQPGISSNALAAELRLPSWYVTQMIRYLDSVGAITPEPPGWRLAPDHRSERR
jgi:transcriptional regulator with XRE-family HTH domain